MALESKICGVSDRAALAAAARGGARWVGFVFFPPSPRAVTVEQAASLAGEAPPGLGRVGLFVDPDDALLERVLAAVPLELLQLHGDEPPKRVAEIRGRFGRPVMKAIKVARREDLEVVEAYAPVADRLLFDAKAPKSMAGALPGGNALSFDWTLLAGRRWPKPWMLSGGLKAENLEEAVTISGAPAVDVSSGVESAPGVKDPARIAAFLELARSL
ncbi:phosphoribosylanthranilate isomerase [Tistlia consotensis]|uniref:N-(5'-phosphoribosyl)anthranilate isomerase n=1 Tax=Tistlia consotensis USBA 355 TaxID=560819 RepID=A0A1Y6B684_9PROT|nr:phosphoribosylanthranilate isomerase [Tistlia consotensis]SME94253.1 phosphoribosylanthranilate isomerase [Tistlia consotensis USBA 355]SNR29204.1 phosphoribosylanthranilate isomerase [Tistlia consotensis]